MRCGCRSARRLGCVPRSAAAGRPTALSPLFRVWLPSRCCWRRCLYLGSAATCSARHVCFPAWNPSPHIPPLPPPLLPGLPLPPAGILYDFFPTALRAVLPPGANPAGGLGPEAARAVAGAALTVATLMNAPPGFLEFLLCVPWADLGPLYLQRERGDGELSIPQVGAQQARGLAGWGLDGV